MNSLFRTFKSEKTLSPAYFWAHTKKDEMADAVIDGETAGVFCDVLGISVSGTDL
jgi:hypothetical protein